MVAVKSDIVACPTAVAVIGGGRWARVLTEVLCEIVPPEVEVSVHSPHNAGAMSTWASSRGLGRRIRVSAEWPRLSATRSQAVIVANAARDHEKAVEYVLSAGVPVLVEKPVALTAVASHRLAAFANDHGVRFAVTQTFLFARYLERFAKLVSELNGIQSFQVLWMDPQRENRYGEQKQYDSGLPIVLDWMPHVLSIAGAVMPNLPQRCEKLAVSRGGAHVEIEFLLGEIPCTVQLIRNGDRRQRKIGVAEEKSVVELDFSKEPGTIIGGSTTMNGDPDWDLEQRPVARMLTAFLSWVAGAERDCRLDIETSLRASLSIDRAMDLYRSAMKPWLIARLVAFPREIDVDLRYALSEILQSPGRLTASAVEQRIERIRQQLSGVASDQWLSAMAKSQDPSSILRSIAV